MIAEVSSSQTRARMRGAISITVTLMPSSAADAAISSPTTPPPIRISDFSSRDAPCSASASASVRR